MPPGTSDRESHRCGATLVRAARGDVMAKRTDGAATVQTALVVVGAVCIAVLVALALVEWFGRLS